MSVGKRAVIEWISPEEGGRRSGPPVGPDYAAPAKFLAYSDTWSLEAWDLVVHKVECLGGPNKWLADVLFRVNEAPHVWLIPKAVFELYEGKRCVATGIIAGE
jgi:hypothetical protein